MKRSLTHALPVAVLAMAFGGCDEETSDGGAGGASGSQSVSASRSSGAYPTIVSIASTGAVPVTSGGGSPECQAYCNTIQANCTVANSQYTSTSACFAACMQMTLGTPGQQMGDTLACRQHHANLAETMPVPHCEHAGPDGGGVCVD